MLKLAKKAGLRLLQSREYYVCHRTVLPYGVDYIHDIKRLCAAWSIEVRSFMDVGAAVGEISRQALAAFPKAVVFAFEPTQSTFDKLCEYTIAGRDRFRPVRFALADHVNPAIAFYQYIDCWNNSLVRNPPHYRPESERSHTLTTVPCTTIDQFCKDNSLDRIDVLKIDAERCDFLVLQGAHGMLRDRRIRFVYFEFNKVVPTGDDAVTTLSSMAEFLSSFGFRLIATYIDRIETQKFFSVANALFVLPPVDDAFPSG